MISLLWLLLITSNSLGIIGNVTTLICVYQFIDLLCHKTDRKSLYMAIALTTCVRMQMSIMQELNPCHIKWPIHHTLSMWILRLMFSINLPFLKRAIYWFCWYWNTLLHPWGEIYLISLNLLIASKLLFKRNDNAKSKYWMQSCKYHMTHTPCFMFCYRIKIN